jgi:Arc/MetJ family transcription regulator
MTTSRQFIQEYKDEAVNLVLDSNRAIAPVVTVRKPTTFVHFDHRWISQLTSSDILMSVTKRLVDVDDDKLEQVRALLGTSTTKATVNGALEEVLALDARRQALLDEAVAGSADLAQGAQRRAAWA